MAEPATKSPIIAIFASDKGPGDPERASIMGQTGSYFARRGASIIVLAENGIIPVPLITAARAAGGVVTIVADETIVLPPALGGVTMEVLGTAAERQVRIAALADAFVALPGSLQSATELFGCWSLARGQGRLRPVVMLNRHRSFEVLRGYAADVLAPGLRGYDKAVQFADSVEDLWNRAARLATDSR